MTEKRTLTISLMGNELTIVSEDTDEHVKKVVDFVTERMKQAREKSTAVSTQTLALLAVLNIADEFIAYQEKAGLSVDRMLDTLDKVK